MKRLIIADVKSNNNKGKCTGHYFAVARNYLDLFSDICHVSVAGGPVFNTGFTDSQLMSLPYDSVVGKNGIINKWNTLKNCWYLFRNTSSDDVVVLQHSGASTTFLGIALFGRRKNSIYVIQYDTDAISSLLKRLIYYMARGKIKGLICPSARIAKAYDKDSCIVTDYIYPHDKLTGGLSFEHRVYDVAIVGSIYPDKGVVEAVKRLANTNIKVLVAGKAEDQQTATLKELCQTATNIELKLGFVCDDDYYGYIRKSRYCMLNYRGVYEERSSGVVLDILFNGTPILGHKCKALQFVEDERVGILFDDIDTFDVGMLKDKSLYVSLQVGIFSYLNKQKENRQKVIDYLGLI